MTHAGVDRASSADPLAPPPGHPRFPHLDGVRGIAALMIVVYHCAILTLAIPASFASSLLVRLNLGVVVFFVLSGFLLYRPFVAAQHAQGPAPRLRTYIAGRALRIVPAYWVALTICLVVGFIAAAMGTFPVNRWDHWWIYYGFAQVYRFDYMPHDLPHAWTLCVELSFYAVLPLYAMLASRLGRGAVRLRRELVLLGLLGVASFVVRVALLPIPGDSKVLTFGTNTLAGTLAWFCVGMAFATWSVVRGVSESGTRARNLLGFAAVAYIVIAYSGLLPKDSALPRTHPPYAAEYLLLCVPAGLLVLAAIVAGDTRTETVLSRVAASLGRVSYGVYLWHFPLVFVLWRHGGATWLGPHNQFMALTLVTVPAAVVAGALSFVIVEQPALRLKSRLQRRAITA